MSEMVKKYHVALFIKDDNDNWVRVKKSTAFELSLNPETQDYDYLTDQNPTTELLRYKPSLSQAITMYKDEPDYEIVFSKFYKLDTGSQAKTDILIVFMLMGDSTNGYKAWKNEAVLTVQSMNTVDSTITVDINFGGTIERGTCLPDPTTHAPVFTRDASGESGWVDPFEAPAESTSETDGETTETDGETTEP